MREVLFSGRSSVVLLSLAMGAFAFNTVEMVPLGMLTRLQAGLDLSAQQSGALISGYALVIAVVTVPLVQLSGTTNVRALTVGLLAVLTVCTLVFATSNSLAATYGSRFLTAAAHGVMWSVMAPAAVAHFSPRLRGRVLAVLSVGGSLAAILGVPGATLLSGVVGWRVPFLAIAALGAASTVALLVSMSRVQGGLASPAPPHEPQPQHVAFAATLATVTASTSAVFVTLTYLSWLPNGATLSPDRLTQVLLIFGLAGALGGVLAGRWVDQRRAEVLTVALVLLLSGLAAWTAGGHHLGPLYAGGMLVGASALVIPLTCQHLLFDNSPVTMTMAFAMNSLAFNVGVATGGFIGGEMLRRAEASTLPLASLALAAIACATAAVAVRATRSREVSIRANAPH